MAATTAPMTPGRSPVRRRDLQKDQTRIDLALAAFELAKRRGLGNVRVPEIAAAVGVSTRTFNNYFSSKEHAIAWLAGRHAAGMAETFRATPADKPLGEALMAAVMGQYGAGRGDWLPAHWLRDFRSLVAQEPTLHGEYLTAMASAERVLADAIATRAPSEGKLRARLLAAMVVAAERAAVMYWMENRSGSLVGTVREALQQALAGIEDRP